MIALSEFNRDSFKILCGENNITMSQVLRECVSDILSNGTTKKILDRVAYEKAQKISVKYVVHYSFDTPKYKYHGIKNINARSKIRSKLYWFSVDFFKVLPNMIPGSLKIIWNKVAKEDDPQEDRTWEVADNMDMKMGNKLDDSGKIIDEDEVI